MSITLSSTRPGTYQQRGITLTYPTQKSSSSSSSKEKNNGGFWGGVGYLFHQAGLSILSTFEGMWDITAGTIADMLFADEWADRQFANDWVNYNAADEWYNPGKGWKIAGGVIDTVPYAAEKIHFGATSTIEGVHDYIAGGITSAIGWDDTAKKIFDDDLGDYGYADRKHNVTGGWRKTSGDVASAIGSFVPIAVANYFLPGSGKYIAAMSAAGNATKEAYRQTGELGLKEYGYGAAIGVTTGIIEGASDKLGVGTQRVTDIFKQGVTGLTAKSAAKTAGKEMAETITKKAIVKGVFKEMGKQALSEGIEEAIEEWVAPYYQRATYDPTAANATPKELMYAFSIGAISGALISGGTSGISASRNYSFANTAINEGRADTILEKSRYFAETETANETGLEVFKNIKGKYDALQKSLAETNGQYMRMEQKLALGELNSMNAVATVSPFIVNDAKAIVLNAETQAERFNSLGFKDEAGNNITITAESLTKGIDLTLAEKKPKAFQKQVAKALSSNPVLATFAVMDATGQFMMDADMFMQASMAGRELVTEANFHKFMEEATPEQKAALGEEFDISDWNTLSYEAFQNAMAEYMPGPKSASLLQQLQRINKIKRVGAESAQTIPIKLPDNMSDGAYRYDSSEGPVGIYKEGDNYYVYSFANRMISFAQSKADINQLLGDINELIESTKRTVPQTGTVPANANAYNRMQTQSTVPQLAKPQVTLPQTTAPKIAVPQTTTPQATVPRVNTTQVVKPQLNTPQAVASQVVAPQIAAPQAVTPQVTTPKTAIPQNNVLKNNVGENNSADVNNKGVPGELTRINAEKMRLSDRDLSTEGKDFAVADDNVIDVEIDGELAQRIANSDKSKYAVIRDYLIENFYGEMFELSDGTKAIMDKSDAQHLSHKAGSLKTAELSNLREVIEKAEYSHDANNPTHKKFDKFKYYAFKVRYGGETFDMLLNVGRSKYDKQYHIYDITKNGRVANQSSTDLARPVGYALKNNSSTNNIIPENAANVNKNSENIVEGKGKSVDDSKADTKSSRIDSINPQKIHEYLRENVKGYKELSVPNQVMVRSIIRQGRALGIPDADLLLYAKVATRSGVNVAFDKQATYLGKSKKTGKDIYADGFYERGKNRIVVNPEGNRSARGLLIHELAHAIFKTTDGAIIAMKGVENLSQAEKDEITNKYAELHKDASEGEISIKIADEVSARYAEGLLRHEGVLERLVSDKPTLKDKILNFFKKAESDYADTPKLNAEAKKLYRQYKTLFDGFAARNANSNAIERTARVDDKEYAFTDSKSGRANDKLSGYDDELKRLIANRGDYIVDTYDKLTEVVDLAFDNTGHKATAYFGIIDSQTLEKIKNSVPNLPTDSKDTLFKSDRGYSIAVTLDSIRHLTDEKGLGREDVVDYLDRLADTIVDFDSVTFDYYTDSYNKKNNGLLFKKKFDDGTLVSFDIVSNKKRSISLQTMYLERGDYQKKKFAKTLPLDNPHGHTSETRAGQTSNNSISQNAKKSTQKSKNVDGKDFALPDGVDADTVIVSRGELEKIKANYQGDRAFSQKDVQSALKSIDAWSGVPAQIRRGLENEIWRGYNMRRGRQGYELFTELAYDKLCAVIQQENDFSLGHDELAKLETQVAGALREIVDSGKESVRSKMKSEVEAEVKQEMEKLQKSAAYWKAQYNDLGDRTKVIGNLSSAAQTMKDLKLGIFANASEYRSDIFKGSIERLSGIQWRGNVSVKSTRKIAADLLQWYSKDNPLLEYASDENSGYFVEDIRNKLEGIANGEKAFTLAELRDLRDVMAYLTNLVKNYNKVFIDNKYVEAAPLANGFVNTADVNSAVGVGVLNNPKLWYEKNFGDPLSVVKWVDQYQENGFYTEMFRILQRAGLDAQIAEMKALADYQTFMDEQKGYEKRLAEVVEYNGKKMTVAQLMSLYMTSKREQAWAGLIINGYTYVGADGKDIRVFGRAHGQNVKEIDLNQQVADMQKEIEALLSKQDKEYIKIVEAGFETAKQLKVDRDMQRYGFTNALEGYYYPIMRANTAKSIDTSMKGDIDRVSSASFNKDTVQGAAQELRISGADVVFLRHIHAVTQYAYLSPSIETFNKLFNLDISGNKNKAVTVKTQTKDAWNHQGKNNASGKHIGEEYFRKLIEDIQGIHTYDEAGNFIAKMRGNYATFALGANPKVWFTQGSSLFAATSIIDYDSIVAGFRLNAKDVDTYCDLAQLRNTDNSAAKAQGVVNSLSKTADFLMKPIGTVDRIVVKRLFAACQIQVEKNGGGKIGTDANKIAAGELLERVILETQQNALATERSSAMRSSSEFAKAITMFSADAMKVTGRVIDAYGEMNAIDRRIKLLQKVQRDGIIYLDETILGGNRYGGEEGQAGSLGGDGTNARGDEGALSQAGDRRGVSEEVGEITQADRQNDKLWDGHRREELKHKSKRFSEDAFITPRKGTVEEYEYNILEEYGIEGYVVDKSDWNIKDPALARDGRIYIRENLAEYQRGMIVSHEATHVMKELGYKPYLDFVERTPSMLNMSSSDAINLIQQCAEHRKVDILNVDLKENRKNEFNQSKVYDEVNATVYGHIASGNLAEYLEMLHEAFNDFDAYAKELTEIHEQFKKDNKAASEAESVDMARTDTQAEAKNEKAQAKRRTIAEEIEALQKQKKAASKKLGRAVGAMATSALFMAVIAKLFRWVYHRDRDKEPEEKRRDFIIDLIGNFFGGLPIFKEVYGRFAEGYELDNPTYSMINDVLNSAAGVMEYAKKSASGEATKQDGARLVRNLVYAGGQVTGIPIRNIYNLVYGVVGFNEKAAYKWDNAFYQKNYRNDLYKYIEDDNDEMVAFTMDLVLEESIGSGVSDSVKSELVQLIGDGRSVLPRNISSTVTYQGQEYQLSDGQLAAVRSEYAKQVNKLDKLFSKSQYKSLSSEDKERAIKYAYDIYYEEALSSALGIETSNSTLVAKAIGTENLALFAVATRGLESDKDSSGKAVAGSKRRKVLLAINSLGLTKEKKLLLLCAKGYSIQDGDIRGLSAENAKRVLLKYILSLKVSKDEKAQLAAMCGFEVTKNGRIVAKSVFSA